MPKQLILQKKKKLRQSKICITSETFFTYESNGKLVLSHPPEKVWLGLGLGILGLGLELLGLTLTLIALTLKFYGG